MTGTKRIGTTLLLVVLGTAVAGAASAAEGRAPEALEADVSQYVWESRDGTGAGAEEAVALWVRAIAPDCRVIRSFVQSREGSWAVFTEESAIEPEGVRESASYRGLSPEASSLEVTVRAPIDLSGHTVSSVTAKAFEEAVERLSDREIEEAAARQTVSIRRGGGAATELRGVEDGGRLAERVVERLAEAEGLTPEEALISAEAVHQLARLLEVVWAQERGILLFSRENLLVQVLREVYPEPLRAGPPAGERLSMRRVRVEGRDAALDVAKRWADDFGMVDPLEGTCLAGRLATEPEGGKGGGGRSE